MTTFLINGFLMLDEIPQNEESQILSASYSIKILIGAFSTLFRIADIHNYNTCPGSMIYLFRLLTRGRSASAIGPKTRNMRLVKVCAISANIIPVSLSIP